ncbi:hypothetical protein ACFB49_27750 [Sphingomonas sp. DBB INV C78]|uniref:DUF4272 domain-containing protein n=1 Tax=Sphingomonas sp. DBB INV C78 TaxID=3349434 RepID=UPI0036D42776
MENDTPDQIRSPVDVARRALTLFAVVAVGLGADREEIIEWLRENDLFEELSPVEARFIEDPEPSERQIINASWYSERLIALLWALDLASMPPADEQCDTSLLQDRLPPYAEVSERDFIKSAKLRSEEELIAMADQILNLHWEARDARIHDRPPRNVDLGIIQERHHAINWVIGYDGLPWDEVTTDT